MKKCPYCAEEIQDAAIVCRYCGRDLQPSSKPGQQIQKPPAKKQSPNFLGILLVIAAFWVLARVTGGNSTPTAPTAKPMVKGADSVVIITFTPATTITPSATRTRVATRTPSVTRTPKATIDTYVLVAQDKFIKFADALKEVNEFTQRTGDNPTIILDEDWKTKTGLALGVLNFRADEMANLEPTPSFEAFHSYLIEIAKETHLFTSAYAQGIDNFDNDSISAATEHLLNMTRLMKTATLELQRISDSQ